MSEKFRTSLKDAYGRDQPGYRLPKREACLMAMSYSYDLQARVFDRMTALEARHRLWQRQRPDTLLELIEHASDYQKHCQAMQELASIAVARLIAAAAATLETAEGAKA